MPELVRLYIRQCLIGFALAALFVALLLGFDVAGLRRLVMATEGGFLAVFLLFFFNGLVFAGVQFGMTIMRMARTEGGDRGGRRHAMPSGASLAAVPVPAPRRADVAGPQRP